MFYFIKGIRICFISLKGSGYALFHQSNCKLFSGDAPCKDGTMVPWKALSNQYELDKNVSLNCLFLVVVSCESE